ncbi:MAG: hypothetical protein JWP36_2359 [Paucimonas sp.]|nr:hypothetical protein [Paucimonas sp.]
MKTTSTHNRFSMLALLVLSGVLVLSSFWVLEVMRRTGEQDGPVQKRFDPDYFVENFTYLKLSRAGGRYNLAGKRLEHNPVDDTHLVQSPVVNSYSDDKPPVKATAQRAIVSSDNSQVHLYDDVKVDRPAAADSKDFHVRSEYLLVLPNEDIVKTHKPVEITVGRSVLRGTGMLANNITRQLQLASSVRATFAPPERGR